MQIRHEQLQAPSNYNYANIVPIRGFPCTNWSIFNVPAADSRGFTLIITITLNSILNKTVILIILNNRSKLSIYNYYNFSVKI